jgi:hypothetical protein
VGILGSLMGPYKPSQEPLQGLFQGQLIVFPRSKSRAQNQGLSKANKQAI